MNVSVYSPISDEEIQRLHDLLGGHFVELTCSQRDELVRALQSGAAHYKAETYSGTSTDQEPGYLGPGGLRGSINRQGRRGNRPRVGLHILLHDCAAALESVTGRPAPIYAPHDLFGKESEALLLARIVHEAIHGKPLAQSLDRVARQARKITSRRS